MRKKLVLIGLFFCTSVFSYATTFRVPSETYPTIQAGMNVASPGDTVLVANGTYTGDGNLFLNFNGKAIVVKSENGPEDCIIDCQNNPNIEVFQLYTGENREAIIEGFKIINGGWVISMQNSSPTIKGNIFENDTCGIYCGSGSSPLIENNIFSNNILYGIACYNASPLIRNNTITNNKYLGIRSVANSNPQIENNTISNNQASGISCSGSTGTINNNTLVQNARNGVYCQTNSSPAITNNVISNNGWPGIFSKNSSPEIRDNQINENSVGIYYEENSDPLIENNTISKNNDEGIYCHNSTGTIRNNTISQNNSHGILSYQSLPGIIKNQIIENNDITNNLRGIYLYTSSPRITNNKIQDNTDSGIYVVNSAPAIINNIITNNIGTNGGGIMLTSFSKASIINNIISDNIAVTGGGIYALNDSSNIINNTIANNRAITGIGIFSNKSDQILTNNIIAFSKRILFSGGVNIVFQGGMGTYSYSGGMLVGYNESKRFVNMGNAGDVTVYVYGYEPFTFFIDRFEKFTLNINWRIRQSGYVSTADIKFVSEGKVQTFKSQLGAEYVSTSSVSVTKQGILAGGGVVALDSDTDKVSNCIFFENTDGNYFSGENAEDEIDIASSNDNLIDDPLFFVDGQYVLSINSPCIDKGVADTTGLNLPEFDIYGTKRILDGDGDGNAVIDIGACEFNESLLGTHEYIAICQGDEYNGWTVGGDYRRILISINGKDSIVTTHLTVHPAFKPTFSVDGNTLISDAAYPDYQWCNIYGDIAGETGATCIITESGEYYLTATDENGCTYASDPRYVEISSTGVEDNTELSSLVIPNPNNGNFLFRIHSNPTERLTIQLINSFGQALETRLIDNPTASQSVHFNGYHLNKGVYHLVVITENEIMSHKIIIY